jgi:hypothetical protein
MSQYCNGYEEESVIQEYFHTIGDELGKITTCTLETSFGDVPQLM